MYAALFYIPSPHSPSSEIEGGGYERRLVSFDASGHNDTDVIFPTATAAWGRIDKFSVMSSQLVGSGYPIYSGYFSPPITINVGDTLQLPIGALTTLGCGGVSQPTEPIDPVRTIYTVDNLTPGNAVYINSSGYLALANTNSLQEASVVGLAASESNAGDMASYNTDGYIRRDDWTTVTGTTYLEAGKAYFLDNSGGMLTTTAPTTGYSTRVGTAIYTDTMDIEIQAPIILSP